MKRRLLTAQHAKYCFIYLFAIFNDPLSPNQTFSSFKLKFSDSIFLVLFFLSDAKNHTAKQIKRLFFLSVKTTNNK